MHNGNEEDPAEAEAQHYKLVNFKPKVKDKYNCNNN